jgi:hypothetical protein
MENNTQTKPNLVMAIALMTLVNGIFNVIWGIGIIVGTIGLSLLCFPVPLFPIILGGFEIAYAIKLLETPPQPVKPSQAIAVLEIAAVFVLNIFSMVVGILVLIFYNDETVKEYFARLNGKQTPPPATPEPAPVLPVEPTPEPPAPDLPVELTPEPPAPDVPAETEAPAEPQGEAPAKPKRSPRKVAQK